MKTVKSWIEISRAALATNFAAIREVVGADVEVLPVVKADAYGHGAAGVAAALVEAGSQWLGVTDTEEGLQVRETVGAATQLLAMVGMEAEDADTIVMANLTPCIWTAAHVQWLEEAATAQQGDVRVHLEVETGMARQGAAPGEELREVLQALQQAKHVVLDGVMTHLSESEVRDSAITRAQLERFDAALTQVHEHALQPRWIHLGNSSSIDEASTLAWIQQRAASLRAASFHARAMVRPGYATYGHCLPLSGNGEAHLAAKLTPALTWKTRIIGLRTIEAGRTVGYGSTFVAQAPMQLALLPVGYSDGFRRAASSGLGNGWVMIHGQRANVVGRVSMNLLVVDVTAIANASIGDEVTLLGEGVTAEDHAIWANTIGYEILCGIKARAILK
ncbi:alanine racemase [Granulicella cerasi]|uniref:Alanine racemase n=1 Tax=Granulicella cerasi TaxID=741063 RepID=A0ABW1Z969_9BACT|nr:alanine racemase [Granulicella cerasi]